MRFACLSIVALFATYCLADDPHLGFRFKEGRKFTGQLVFDEKLLGETDGDHRRHQVLDFDWTDGSPEADGSCVVTISYQRLRTERTNGNGKKTEQFDTRRNDSASGRAADYATAVRAVKGKVLKFRLHKDGRTSEVEPPQLSKRMPEMTRISASVFLQSTMSTKKEFQPIITLLPQFSADSSKSGGTWVGGDPRFVHELQSLKVIPTFSMGSTDPLVHLDSTYKWEQIKTPGGFMDRSFEVARVAGSVEFDPKKGCVVESTFEFEKSYVPLHLQHKGGGRRVQGEYSWRLKLKEQASDG